MAFYHIRGLTVEYLELSQPFEGTDRSEVSGIDLCPPQAKGVEFGRLCANLSGYVNKSQMMAAVLFKDMIDPDAVEQAKQEKAAQADAEEAAENYLDSAKSLVQTGSAADEEFGSKMIEKFNAVWQKDKQILQRDGKALSDFDYREIGHKDRLIIAAMYALVFMVG